MDSRPSLNTTAGTRYWIEAIAANLADVGIKAEIKIWETAAIVCRLSRQKIAWFYCAKFMV